MYIASKWQYLFNFELVPKDIVNKMNKIMKDFIFGKAMSFRCVDKQTKAGFLQGGVGMMDFELQNRATLVHWVVQLGNKERRRGRKFCGMGTWKTQAKL